MAVAATIVAAVSAVYSYLGLGLGRHGTAPAQRALGRAWAWPEARRAGMARTHRASGRVVPCRAVLARLASDEAQARSKAHCAGAVPCRPKPSPK